MGKSLVVDNGKELAYAEFEELEQRIIANYQAYESAKHAVLRDLWEGANRRLWKAGGFDSLDDWLGDLSKRCGVRYAARNTFYNKVSIIKFGLAHKGFKLDEAIDLAIEHEGAAKQLMAKAADVVKDGRGLDAEVEVTPTDAIPEYKENPTRYLRDIVSMPSSDESIAFVKSATGSGRIWVSLASKMTGTPDVRKWANTSIVLEVRDERGGRKDGTSYVFHLRYEADTPRDVVEEVARKLWRREIL